MATGRTIRRELSRKKAKAAGAVQFLRKSFPSYEAAARWVASCEADGWTRTGIYAPAFEDYSDYLAVVQRPRVDEAQAMTRTRMSTFESYGDAVDWAELMKQEGLSRASIRWNGTAYLVVMTK